MNIAVLSDIHGNLPALEAVVKHMSILNIEKVLVLGDIVGYYYQAKEVLNILKNLPNVEFIQGNHERHLAAARENSNYLDLISKKYGSGIRIAIHQLSDADLDWLVNLPQTKTVHVNNLKILMCHGSPENPDDYIYPDAKLTRLDNCVTREHDYILMGNTHYPFVCMRQNTLLLNPGSVGQPRDIGSLASFATINVLNGAVMLHRVVFDVASVKAMVKNIDINIPYLSNIFDRK